MLEVVFVFFFLFGSSIELTSSRGIFVLRCLLSASFPFPCPLFVPISSMDHTKKIIQP